MNESGFDKDGWWHGELAGVEVVLRLTTQDEGDPPYISGQRTIDLSADELRLFVLAMGGSGASTRLRMLPAPGARFGYGSSAMEKFKEQLRRSLRIVEVDMTVVDEAFAHVGMPSDFRGAMYDISTYCDTTIKGIRRKSKSIKANEGIKLLSEVAASCRTLSYLTRLGDWLLFDHLCEACASLIDAEIESYKQIAT
jgi:hypothetical protein